MTESEKLDLILVKLGKMDKLDTEFGGFKESFDRLETEFGGLTERLDGLGTKFGEFEERFDGLETKLGEFEKRFDGLETKFGEFEGRLDNLETGLEKVEERLDKLDNDVTGMKMTLENEIRPNIMRVAEGHLDLYRKLRETTKIDDEKEMIAIRVNIVEEQLRTIKDRLDQIA